MPVVTTVRADFYQLPLPVVLTDSTHGAIPHFELVTVRLEDSDGARGLGYTCAVNSGAEAFAVLIDRYLAPVRSPTAWRSLPTALATGSPSTSRRWSRTGSAGANREGRARRKTGSGEPEAVLTPWS